MFVPAYFPDAYFPPGWQDGVANSGGVGLETPTAQGGVARRKRYGRRIVRRKPIAMLAGDDDDALLMIVFLTEHA